MELLSITAVEAARFNFGKQKVQLEGTLAAIYSDPIINDFISSNEAVSITALHRHAKRVNDA